MRAVIHVQGWRGSEPAEPGETATALVHGVLQLDGKFVENGKITFETGGTEIVRLTTELIVEDLEIIVHDTESWAQMQEAYREQNE